MSLITTPARSSPPPGPTSTQRRHLRRDAWHRFIRERVPLGRPQTVEEIGQAAVFLCQADNITGESINVTGGSEMG